jgi:hypothetical protein
LPAFLAFDSPMAMACFGLVTFFPLRPDFRVPFFISFISVSTFLPEEGEYFRVDDFLAAVFFAGLFLAELFLLVLFFAALFLVAIFILLEAQMVNHFMLVVCFLGTFRQSTPSA